jgi:hypothetical protein
MIEPQIASRKCVKKSFEVMSAAGKLRIEVQSFERYAMAIVVYAGLLKVDGGLMVVHPTPYVFR